MEYSYPTSERLHLTGVLGNDTIDVQLHRIPDEAFPLFNPRWWWNNGQYAVGKTPYLSGSIR